MSDKNTALRMITVSDKQDSITLVASSVPAVVQAVNSHAKLLAAAAAIMPYYCEHLRGVGVDPNDSEIVARLREAISESEEQC